MINGNPAEHHARGIFYDQEGKDVSCPIEADLSTVRRKVK